MDDSGLVRCPRCLTENRSDRAHCYLCGRPLDHADPVRAALPAPKTQGTGRLSIQIGSLMLLIALVAMMLGIWREAPGLAILLTIPTVIALWSTVAASRRNRDRPPTVLEHILVFLTSFLTVVIVSVAAGAAFFVTCLAIISTRPGAYGGDLFGLGLLCGLLVGGAVLIALSVMIFQARKRRRARDKPPSEREL